MRERDKDRFKEGQGGVCSRVVVCWTVGIVRSLPNRRKNTRKGERLMNEQRDKGGTDSQRVTVLIVLTDTDYNYEKWRKENMKELWGKGTDRFIEGYGVDGFGPNHCEYDKEM